MGGRAGGAAPGIDEMGDRVEQLLGALCGTATNVIPLHPAPYHQHL
ncbi:hypothetical protein ACIRYZ_43780 [Kitasatospora sp. NPDC101155]